jgi:hypothetical protein
MIRLYLTTAMTAAILGVTGYSVSSQVAKTPDSSSVVGIIKAIHGDSLDLKLKDGRSQRYSMQSGTLPSVLLKRGSFVEARLQSGSIQALQTPSIEKVSTGKILMLVDDQITLELPDGSSETVTASPFTIERMGLLPGDSLSVTHYRGITLTKLCPGRLASCCKKQSRLPVQVVTPPLPQPTRTPIQGLW